MAQVIARLTLGQLDRLSATPGMLHDGPGLYLRVNEQGAASWIYRYELRGRKRAMGLGPLTLFGLHEARAKAHDARRLRYEGIDPIDARKAARRENTRTETFKHCADAYIKSHRPAWRNDKHAAQLETTPANYAEPIIGDLPVQSTDRRGSCERPSPRRPVKCDGDDMELTLP